MAPRAVWTGQLRLSLVSMSIEIYPATTSGPRVPFRQIHKPSGKPVRYEKTVKGVGAIKTDDIVKGYKTEDGEYILLDPEEIDELKVETSKKLDLLQFVESREIPPIYFERPYYVVPKDDASEDAYRVIRDALRAEGKTGLCQISLSGKERLAAIRPCGDGLLLETLRYEEEIRDAEPMFSRIEDEESDDEMLELAQQLIDKKTKPFDASAFSDSYHDALLELIEAKRKNRKTETAPAETGKEDDGDNVVDLMGALKKSVEKSGGKGSSGGSRSSGSKKSSSGSGGRKSTGSKSSSGSSRKKKAS